MIAGMPALLLPAQQYVETVPLIVQKRASLKFFKVNLDISILRVVLI